ncbi:MAG: hypothetical protein ACOCW6_03090 [Spirochaetota bacterium]
MKRTVLLVLLVALVGLPAFALPEVGLGLSAFYNSPVMLGQDSDKEELNVDKFTFGGNGRVKLAIFHGEALLLYSNSEVVKSLDVYLDAGVAFDVLTLLRLSAGAGPALTYNIGESDEPVDAGLNVKLNADVKLARLSAGLSYIMDLNLDNGIDIDTSAGLLGASVLFWF